MFLVVVARALYEYSTRKHAMDENEGREREKRERKRSRVCAKVAGDWWW